MKFAVVVVTYNRIELLKECIETLLNQTYKFEKICIIDNGSTDGTKKYLEKYYNQSEFEIRHLTPNRGGAFGFSYGLEILAKHEIDWILIIDDDAIIKENYNEKIAEFIPRISANAFSGTVITDDKIDFTHRKKLTNSIFMKSKVVEEEEYSKEYFSYDLSSFCGLVINKNLLIDIGFPNVDYYQWYVDTEYSLRIRKKSLIVNINTAILEHKVKYKKKTDIINWTKSYYGYINQIYMGMEYSTKKSLFCIYIYIRHILKILYLLLSSLIFIRNRDLFIYRAIIHKDVIFNSIKKMKGLNDKYQIK